MGRGDSHKDAPGKAFSTGTSQAVSATYTVLKQCNALGLLFLSKDDLSGHLHCYCPCNDYSTKVGRVRTLFYLECPSAAKAKLTLIFTMDFFQRGVGLGAGWLLLHTSALCPDQRTQQASPALARQSLYCFSSNS